MRFKARIEISLKPGHSDPEGEMTARSLRELNYPVENVNVSKVYTLTFEANSRLEAEKMVEEMCRRLLANPTKDNYRFEIEELK
ncbi:phosphoribosylformylglycinamidine synthase, purS protein [Candidatus Bathyarchaeota archaeon]|nr:MAG: phosphoribosylformylglycinamidine synthase, purS protein [Candidatus Bathyarchaeota archaeon]